MIPDHFQGRAGRATLAGFEATARMLGIDPSVLLAVWRVESGGEPYLQDGRPVILFEAHIFSRLTGGVHDRDHPAISARAWDRSLYNSTRAGEYRRLSAAMVLSPDAALSAASWGGCQILGMNATMAGFADVRAMVSAFCDNEGAHIGAFARFVQARGLLPALRAMDWDAFARGYNGTGYRLNRYAERLAQAHDLEHRALADGVLGPGDKGEAVSVLQRLLVRSGTDIVPDGVYGRMTGAAVERVQARAGLPVTGLADGPTLAAVQAMTGEG